MKGSRDSSHSTYERQGWVILMSGRHDGYFISNGDLQLFCQIFSPIHGRLGTSAGIAKNRSC